MENNDVVRALAALAQASHLQVFRALLVAGHTGLVPGVIAETPEVPAATLSFHLKEPVHAGLVSYERSLIYRADFSQMQALLAYLRSHCCEGGTCDVALPPFCQSAMETA